MPVWRPLRLASKFLRTRERECIFTAFRMMRPSLINFLMLKREFAIEISFASLGSSQIRPLPHFLTSAAKRFCSFIDMALAASGAGAQRQARRGRAGAGCLSEAGGITEAEDPL